MDFTKRYVFDPKTDLLGKGGFSKVYKAYDSIRKRYVALKFFYGNWSDKYDVIGEINRMEDIIHPNLIRYYDATIIESVNGIGEIDRVQVGIMEFADAGDITLLLKNKSIPLIKSVIKDVLEGLKFLHSHQIVHRDLKPKNILFAKDKLGNYVAKIADFGISKKIGFEDKTASTQLLGSVEYMAPEQFNPTKYGLDGKLTTNLDLWALGIIIYELFTQETPFGNRSTGLSNEEILSNILFNDIVIEYNRLEEPYRTIVRRCLVKEAGNRVQHAGELLDILEKKITLKTAQENVDLNATQVLSRPIVDSPQVRNFEQNRVVESKESENRIQPPPSVEPKKEKPVEQVKFEPEPIRFVEPPVRPAASVRTQESVPEVPKQKPITESNYSAEFELGKKSTTPNSEAARAVALGKQYFQSKNFTESYRYLSENVNALEFDTEAKFYLGFMLYNGKCGGAHDFEKGKQLMDTAKVEDRPLVMGLVLKYVLGKKD